MFVTKRLAKRSIVGTAVCALWAEDGYYHSGMVKSTSELSNGKQVYVVFFHIENITKTLEDKDLIGPGFQHINLASLKKGQTVFITHNSREISGAVVHHDKQIGIVAIEIVEKPGKEKMEVNRKIEDVRLSVSRRSARLQDQRYTDYSQLADPSIESRRRIVSNNIDVPNSHNYRQPNQISRCLPGCSSYEEVEEIIETNDELGRDITPEENAHVMDENMAAMILTSFSCSPLSSGPNYVLKDKGSNSSSVTSSSMGSSGVWGLNEKSEANSTSFQLEFFSSSAPTNSVVDALYGSLQNDEGIEVCDSRSYCSEDLPTGSRKRRLLTRTVFKCLWPGCEKLFNTCIGIEKHVRYNHLGPKKPTSYNSSNESAELSDHEEEFYYNEIEVSLDTVTQTFADMYTSSPPQRNSCPVPGTETQSLLFDHDYPKKTSTKMSKMDPGRGYIHCTPPKNTPTHKKFRSDTKKCRKYYGMDNRDLWCTQCKWKKACTRFLDYYSYASQIHTLENDDVSSDHSK